jgi:hypothetical protein
MGLETCATNLINELEAMHKNNKKEICAFQAQKLIRNSFLSP